MEKEEKKKILIIEDDQVFFEYIKSKIKGYTILPENFEEMAQAMSGNGNIEEYVHQQILNNYKDLRLVICDIELSGHQRAGNQVVRKIRSIKELDKFYVTMLPIIIVTDHADRQEIIIGDGADYPIVKSTIYQDENRNKLDKEKKQDIESGLNILHVIIETQINKFDCNLERLNILKDNRRVFIVHGHDSEAIKKVKSMLRNKGFDPIVLRNEPNGGRSIIDKIEDESKKCCFAIILYTKCDEGRLKGTEELKDRARQNVVFEHGYMWSMMGRKRVCALVEKGIEMPGDLSGIVYIPDDKTNDAWCKDVVKEMRYAGLDIGKNND